MADAGLFIGWGPPVRGREAKSLEVFNESVQQWAQYEQDGKIESFRPFLLRPHGGDLAGFILIHGEQPVLDELAASDEFGRLMARAGAVVDNLGVAAAVTDDELGKQMGIYAEVAAGLPQVT